MCNVLSISIHEDNREISCRIAKAYAKQYGAEVDPHTGEWCGDCKWKLDVMKEARRVCRGEDRFE